GGSVKTTLTDTPLSRASPLPHWFCGVLGNNLPADVIATLAVASLMRQLNGIVPEDSSLHVIDLVQAVPAPSLGAG
ncbi:hypothetical protein NUV89_28370, partial [Pseudomonas sp. 18.1.10]|uniref:hypothetical protein n=1 Tax=Pseudomonas sp. 18.1.10 TaxID=2969302 RepID=UPI00215027BC